MTDVSAVFQSIVQTLQGQKQSNGSFNVLCPAHADNNPSCNVKLDGDKILAHCYAGCTQDAVISALKSQNLWLQKVNGTTSGIPAGIFTTWGKHDKKPYVKHWNYHDFSGNTIGYAVRYQNPGVDDKDVIPYFKPAEKPYGCMDPAPRFKPGYGEGLRPLYNLHDLGRDMNSDNTRKPILLVEGEKATDAAKKMVVEHFIPMTWPGGSKAVNKADWSVLKNYDVLIWPDADEPGKKAAYAVQKQCAKAGVRTFRIIQPPDGVKAGWDLDDAVADGWDAGQVMDHIKAHASNAQVSSENPPQDLWSFEDAEIHIQKQKGRELSSSQKVELTEDILNHHGFNSLQLNIIMDLLKKVTGITKGAMADLQKNSEDSKPEDDSRTHAELSVAFIAEKLPHEPNHVVGCEGRIWTYGPVSGVYMDSTMKMLAIQVGDYFTGSDYCKRAGDYKGISNLIYNRLEDTTFFSTAPRGLPGASAFHQVTTDGEHIVREYSPDLRARFKLPVDPDANCPKPRFEKFLKDTFPDDQDQIDLMQEVIGALLCCIAAGLQTAFYFYGEGGNGKNVMLDIVGGLFDDRLKCAIRPDHIVKEYYRAQLAGKLLNIVGEIEKDAFVGSEFKDVVSCDAPVTARLPYHEPFVFIPQCAHLFAGNHLPATKDHSEGQRRRWRFFHFRHRVPEGSRIQYLGQKILKEESPGILFWALSGAQRLMRNGGVLTPTDAHKELLEKWKQSSDSVEAFLHDPETVVLAPSRRCYRQKAFDAYIFFCRESNYRGLSKQNFYHRVESIFPVSRKNSEERHFSGFSLVEKEFHF